MFLTKKLCTLFFQNHCKKHKETKLFFLKCSIYYFITFLLWGGFVQIMLYMVQYMLAVLLKNQAQGEKKYEVYVIIFRIKLQMGVFS